MVFLIDGTNAVRRLYQESRRVPLSEELHHIEEFLEYVAWTAARRRGSEFVVVLDGPPRSFEARRLGGFGLLFGREEGADHVLLDRARYHRHRGSAVTVVTADAALAKEAAHEGAVAMRPEEFAEKLKGR